MRVTTMVINVLTPKTNTSNKYTTMSCIASPVFTRLIMDQHQKSDHSPVHVRPLLPSWNPSSQLHWNDPALLVQTWLQPPLLLLHSMMSKWGGGGGEEMEGRRRRREGMVIL